MTDTNSEEEDAMINMTIKTRTVIRVPCCKEDIIQTSFGIDKGGQLWLWCPCCAGEGTHPYGDDAYPCLSCHGQGEYALEDADQPSWGWPRQN
jgi:hypothetical protein